MQCEGGRCEAAHVWGQQVNQESLGPFAHVRGWQLSQLQGHTKGHASPLATAPSHPCSACEQVSQPPCSQSKMEAACAGAALLAGGWRAVQPDFKAPRFGVQLLWLAEKETTSCLPLSNTESHTSNPGAQCSHALPAVARSQMASPSSEVCHKHGSALQKGLCSYRCASPMPSALALHCEIQVATLIAQPASEGAVGLHVHACVVPQAWLHQPVQTGNQLLFLRHLLLIWLLALQQTHPAQERRHNISTVFCWLITCVQVPHTETIHICGGKQRGSCSDSSPHLQVGDRLCNRGRARSRSEQGRPEAKVS